jgi:prepilin-type processing-associated H-X9-DG protein
MRKIVIGTAVVSSIFALTAAGAAGLGTLTGGGTVNLVNTGQVSVSTTSCTDPLDISYTYSDATHQTITGVVLVGSSNGTTTCEGLTATVLLLDTPGTYSQTGNAVFADGSVNETATITLATPYNVLGFPPTTLTISVA